MTPTLLWMRSRLFRPKAQRVLRIAAGCSWVGIAALSLRSGHGHACAGLAENAGRALAYALSAFMTRLVLQTTDSRAQLMAYSAAAAVFETGRLWTPGRSADVGVWLASSVGALIGIAVARLIAHPPRRGENGRG
ncbi:hypothetical protein [Methylocella sp.]|uniref:hypothetical protein n=1 Tax=Methylocella sp. TaxID=1978226 RepID=UPI0037847271